jgi:hypothetical protein
VDEPSAVPAGDAVPYRVLDDDGRLFDARLDLDDGEIVFHSRGGKRGASGARNLDYGPALRRLLERIARTGNVLRGAWVESDEVLHLPRGRRSILDGGDLIAKPSDQFRIMSRRMQAFGRPTGTAYGGSRVKKIRIDGDWTRDTDEIRNFLRLEEVPNGSTRHRSTDSSAEIDWSGRETPARSVSGADAVRASNYVATVNDVDDVFDPSSIEDEREKILGQIRRRRGQPAFRRALLRIYGGQCAISDCSIESLLEAAHIHPYRGPDTNSVQNGLLLRADIHTLFDCGLITLSADLEVALSPRLANSEYAVFAGRRLRLPRARNERPSEFSLAWHRSKHARW